MEVTSQRKGSDRNVCYQSGLTKESYEGSDKTKPGMEKAEVKESNGYAGKPDSNILSSSKA